MALVKPITLDAKGAVTTYYKVLGYSTDLVSKVGLIKLGAYFSRQSREFNVDPYRIIELPLQGDKFLANPTTDEIYTAIRNGFTDFADALDEHTPAPPKENFPELQHATGLSDEYEKAKAAAPAEKAAEDAAEEEKLNNLD